MTTRRKHADFGPRAYLALPGKLPNVFPRVMGPNAGKYLQEVVESGLTSDMLSGSSRPLPGPWASSTASPRPAARRRSASSPSAFGFEPGDEIIVSPITDYGTIQGLVRENYIPVFADTEPGSVNLSAETIEPCITDRTRAILVVHKTGLDLRHGPDQRPRRQSTASSSTRTSARRCSARTRDELPGRSPQAAAFSFDAEKTMGSDVGGCVVTDDDELSDEVRYIGQSRGAYDDPDFGRVHTYPGYAYRMPLGTAAISLAQLEIIRDNVAHRDRMARLLTALIGEIPGIRPLLIPDYMDVYSCWMFGFSIDPAAFRCSTAEFARNSAEEGITGAGMGRYYLMPDACTFLRERAEAGVYPYSRPPASRTYAYGPATCPNAYEFLKTFIRWNTFSEKYTDADVELAAAIVRRVAERNAR